MTAMSLQFVPAALLALGGLALQHIRAQDATPLRQPLATVPSTLLDLPAKDIPISPEERLVAGMDSYILRYYAKPDSRPAYSVYVGYYEQQTQGRSIHSPRNCLPGAGWETLSSGTAEVQTPGGIATVNRYVLENEGRRAVVYYWYQGRGRVAWNEYRVKYELLRDKALRGRSEEALVRIVVPSDASGDGEADRVATAVASVLIPAVDQALPPLAD